MDNIRVILYLSLGLILFLLWGSWEEWNRPKEVQYSASEQTQQTPPPNAQDLTKSETQRYDDMPAVAKATERGSATEVPSQSDNLESGQRVIVETDVLRAEILVQGGDLTSIELLQIPVDIKNKAIPFHLLKPNRPRYIIQSGLLHDQTDDLSKEELAQWAPSHYARYTSEKPQIRLQDNQEQVRAVLIWDNQRGVTVKKSYTFYRGKYYADIRHEVYNRSAKVWVGRQYRQIRRQRPSDDAFRFIYTFTGAAYYDGKYNKIDFDEMAEQNLSLRNRGGWVSMLQHYFFSALLADKDNDNDFYTRVVSGTQAQEYIIGLRSDAKRVGPGDQPIAFDSRIYTGPKIQNELADIAPGLELATDYGIFSIISKPLFWLLDKIYSFFGNWAVAIILLTVLIKLVFYKLSETSYKSMAKMRKLQPSLTALRERYKGNRQEMQKAMMDFYRKEKINPLGGCLPILVQIPVFIALYWVLLESVELRQAPFILWIEDLSTRDPYFVLPLLMGATMVIQTKLNPTPPDPMQARIMMLMPIVFTGFFAFFPSGLVLYWFVNNLLSIAQQWVINKRIEGS